MKEIFQQNQNLILSIAIIALCLIMSILYLIAFKTMRDRIELQVDEQDKIIKEYQKITNLMTAKGSNDGTK